MFSLLFLFYSSNEIVGNRGNRIVEKGAISTDPVRAEVRLNIPVCRLKLSQLAMCGCCCCIVCRFLTELLLFTQERLLQCVYLTKTTLTTLEMGCYVFQYLIKNL